MDWVRRALILEMPSIQLISAIKKELRLSDLQTFTQLALQYLEQSIDANKRADNLYHAYNLMTLSDDGKEVHISYLSEMLEGQVAVLSSGYLTPGQAIEVLDAQKHSKLFREDQYSYLLYPNKELTWIFGS